MGCWGSKAGADVAVADAYRPPPTSVSLFDISAVEEPWLIAKNKASDEEDDDEEEEEEFHSLEDLESNEAQKSERPTRRPNKERNHLLGHQRLMEDYFQEGSTYNDHDFQRQFCL